MKVKQYEVIEFDSAGEETYHPLETAPTQAILDRLAGIELMLGAGLDPLGDYPAECRALLEEIENRWAGHTWTGNDSHCTTCGGDATDHEVEAEDVDFAWGITEDVEEEFEAFQEAGW